MSGFIHRRALLASGAAVGLAAAVARPAWAQAADPLADLDGLVHAFMAEFGTPGVALAVVRPGQPDLTQGWGVRKLGSPEPVAPDTLFAVASNTKAMTAAALAILVDEGKLSWDEPVVRRLPEFAMYDPATTQAMTVRDLLTHRSGLPLGAGDLMIWPTTTHTRAEVVHGLRYLAPVRGFRTGYDYDNVLYVTAGQLIERVTGTSWESFVTERVLRPAGMAHAVPAPSLVSTADIAARHARLGGPVYGMGEMRVVERQETDSFAPAGGVQAGARDMAAWLHIQLARGLGPDGKSVWSEIQSNEMWAPQTLIGTSAGPTADEPGRSLFATYALGWQVFDWRGERVVAHGGAMNGQLTATAMIPGRGVGITVLTNAEEVGVQNGLRNALLDRLMGAPAFDWAAYYRNRGQTRREAALATLKAADTGKPVGGPTAPLARYAGLYRDPWYGDLEVRRDGEGLKVAFLKTPAFQGPLEPWGPDAFRTRFTDPTVEDAVLTFAVKRGRPVEVTAKAFSPLADFSYDFQHLKFKRIGA
ncbi:serine hydrolase [Caulobacter sp. 17J65-9]|uniref:serine hydrolase n=1 Tax=Caulobacter sp. 17J65-9 TaxID=2709382 RepID=UPI0013C6D1FA|nr:serine hydrolase [Caulobacter sp. 17J65-9]